MARENFLDLNDDTGAMAFAGWRCMICGEILDAVIMSNRASRPAPLHNRNRKFLASR